MEEKNFAAKAHINERLLSEFIRSKQAESILPRTIQQLESRIRAFVKFSKTGILQATTKQAMEFRDELLRSGKSRFNLLDFGIKSYFTENTH